MQNKDTASDRVEVNFMAARCGKHYDPECSTCRAAEDMTNRLLRLERAEKQAALSSRPALEADDRIRAKTGEILAMALDVEPTDVPVANALEQLVALVRPALPDGVKKIDGALAWRMSDVLVAHGYDPSDALLADLVALTSLPATDEQPTGKGVGG